MLSIPHMLYEVYMTADAAPMTWSEAESRNSWGSGIRRTGTTSKQECRAQESGKQERSIVAGQQGFLSLLR